MKVQAIKFVDQFTAAISIIAGCIQVRPGGLCQRTSNSSVLLNWTQYGRWGEDSKYPH